MNASYFILQPDGSQTGPVPYAQVVAYLQQGVLRRESLVRRADLGEAFAIDSYPEFAHAPAAPARPSAVVRPRASSVVPPRASSVVRPKAVPEASGGGKVMVWVMVLLWAALLAWGGIAGWEKWQESKEAKQQAAAEKWKKENLPDYKMVKVDKRRGINNGVECELIIEGELEEKEAKRHPEYGRAERREVYLRLILVADGTGPIGDVVLPMETVLVKDGKGRFTVTKWVPIEVMARLFLMWDRLKVDDVISYEKK